MLEKAEYTKKELQKMTGAPPYTIAYLNDCGRLPIIRESRGRGYSILYHADSIQIIKDHLDKRLSFEGK